MSAAHVRSLSGFAAGVAFTMIVTALFAAWRADAIGADESTFVPITPCRLVDTRPATQVGPRSTPIGADEEYSLQVTGTEGECTIPAAATAVAINLVGVSPTADTFIAIYPANTVNPGTAVLNLVAGQAPTPNKLDVKLAPDGRIKVFNRFGSVHIVGDVLGYYRRDGLADLEQRITALEIAQPFSAHGFDANEVVTSSDEVVASVDVTAPVTGHVVVNSTAIVDENVAGDGARCSITTGSAFDFDADQLWESPGSDGRLAQLAGTRRFNIRGGDTDTYNLVCRHIGTGSSDVTIARTWLTAIFTPAP